MLAGNAPGSGKDSRALLPTPQEPLSASTVCPKTAHFLFRSRRGSPVCITPKGNCPTSPVDAPKAIQPTTEQATGEHGAVQPGPPRCTWNAATNTAPQHLCEGLGALLPRHGHPVLPVGRRPRTKLSGDFNSSSGAPPKSYSTVQPRGGGTRTGTHGGTHP